MTNNELLYLLIADDMVDFNSILMKYYRKLGLDEKDILVLSMLVRGLSKKDNAFLPNKMISKGIIDEESLFKSLEKLMKKEYLEIDMQLNPKTGKEREVFSLGALFDAIVSIYQKESQKGKELPISLSDKVTSLMKEAGFSAISSDDRELIKKWCDDGMYKEEDIVSAIHQSAHSQKSVNEVDSIMLKKQLQEVLSKRENN